MIVPGRRSEWGVRRRTPLFAFLALWMAFALAPARADLLGSSPAPSPCTQAAFTAEQDGSVPIGLLLAIGRIESGRPDPVHGIIAPWPWTINVGGVGRFFASKDDAVAYVRDQQARGVQSIDVGCFQVNLYYHPDAFATLEDAFDPASNARYAASFLTQLRDRSGAWEAAVGMYHSAVPAEGGWYRDRVLATWNGGDIVIPPEQRASFAARPRLSDPTVMVVSVKAYGIQVWTPNGTGAHAMPRSLGGKLPQIIAMPRVVVRP